MGIGKDIIYKEDQYPPALPLAVVIEFKDCTRLNFFRFYKESVPIVPFISQAYVDGQDMEIIHLPLKLCWAITMNKSQGLTLPWINSGMQERSVGLSYVAISRVKSLKNLIVDPLIIARLNSNFQLRHLLNILDLISYAKIH